LVYFVVNVVGLWFSVFELTFGTGQTDGQAETCNVASYGGGPHKILMDPLLDALSHQLVGQERGRA